MLFAVDEYNGRRLPYKGGVAFCPYCNEKVIAACGDINVHHWRHDRTAECDPWKEHETEWHRNWKKIFPKEWQEVIIQNNDEKHIADIKTNNGLVLELQNSSISNQTIEIREHFYKEMVWLINADKFKDNFEIGSLVRSYLKTLDAQYYQPNLYYNPSSYYNPNLEVNTNESIRQLEEELKQLVSERKQEEENERLITSKRDGLSHILIELEVALNNLIERQFNSGLLKDFDSPEIASIRKFNLQIQNIITKLKEKLDLIIRIENFTNCKIQDYEKYKIVPFNDVSPKSFQKCKVVLKADYMNLFPSIVSLKSESDFDWYFRKRDLYILIMDLTDVLASQIAAKTDLEKEIIELTNQRDISYSNLKNDLTNWIIDQIERKKNNLKDLNLRIIELNDLECQTRQDLEQERDRYNKELIESENNIELEKKKKEIEIKTKYKGLYWYNWKYQRKSWNYASCKIFLDFDSHIFEVLSENRLKKHSKENFINMIINWQ